MSHTQIEWSPLFTSFVRKIIIYRLLYSELCAFYEYNLKFVILFSEFMFISMAPNQNKNCTHIQKHFYFPTEMIQHCWAKLDYIILNCGNVFGIYHCQKIVRVCSEMMRSIHVEMSNKVFKMWLTPLQKNKIFSCFRRFFVMSVFFFLRTLHRSYIFFLFLLRSNRPIEATDCWMANQKGYYKLCVSHKFYFLDHMC